MTTGGGSPRVFISFSHDSAEHDDRVLELANRLRGDGVDAWIDRFETSPARGWHRWMQTEIEKADFVVLVCTERYKRGFGGELASGDGRALAWMGRLISQVAYDARGGDERVIPVVFDGDGEAAIPLAFQSCTWHEVPGGYEGLYRQVTGQPAVVAGQLGALRRRSAVSAGIPETVGRWHGIRRWAVAAGVGLLALTALLNGEVSRAVCKVPGLAAVCSAMGAGGVATAEEREVWCAALAALPSAEGLRGYLREYGQGAYAEEAARHVEHRCAVGQVPRWVPGSQDMVLPPIPPGDGFASRKEAERDALARGRDDAMELLCKSYTEEGSSGVFKLDDVRVEVRPGDGWKCSESNGWKCGVEGRMQCVYQRREMESVERCDVTGHGGCPR